MKIAILTQPFKNNYGGILQNWAMQQVLIKLGHEPITILRKYNFDKPSVKLYLYRILSVFKCIFRIYVLNDKLYTISNPFSDTYCVYKSDKSVNDFVQSNIKCTNAIYTTDELRAFYKRNSFDCYLVGSDQVWRYAYSPCMLDFFLGFIPPCHSVKKISYAASFGLSECEIPNSQLNLCVDLLRSFDAVSVREFSGQRILNDIFNRNSQVVVDPTMLISAQEYMKLISTCDYDSEKHLMVYILDNSKYKIDVINDIKSVTGLHEFQFNDAPLNSSGSISMWLSKIYSSEFIITDSFHGCVFSIIFNKPFIVFANNNRGMDRIFTLLKRFDLLDRLVLSETNYILKKSELLNPIDYFKVNLLLKELQEQGYEFLQNSINS